MEQEPEHLIRPPQETDAVIFAVSPAVIRDVPISAAGTFLSVRNQICFTSFTEVVTVNEGQMPRIETQISVTDDDEERSVPVHLELSPSASHSRLPRGNAADG